jgi:hypothetical protein
MFHTHIYQFNGNYYLQQKGGPIGLRATCCTARLTMVEWDRRWLAMMVRMGISIETAMRYMDDLRVFLYAIKMGWRWHAGELCWKEEWEDEDQKSGKGDLERTCELLRQSMNMIFDFLNFTIESGMDFEDGSIGAERYLLSGNAV